MTRSFPGTAAGAMAALLLGLFAVAGGRAVDTAPPLGLPPLPVVADDRITPEKVELGKMLYFDKREPGQHRLLRDLPRSQGGLGRAYPDQQGHPGQLGGRNAPTVINAAYATSQFWDGRAKTLEEQAVGPVGNPIEMGHTMAGVVARLKAIPDYQRRFQDVFGTEVTEKGFAQAVAAFERTVLSRNSAYDRYMAGDKTALSGPAAGPGHVLAELRLLPPAAAV